MTPREQENRFKELKTAHPKWTARFTSGYVHGILDQAERTLPQQAQIDKAPDLDHYALGYLLAFAVHRGAECEDASWFNFIGLMVKK